MPATIKVNNHTATVTLTETGAEWECKDSMLRAKCVLYTPALDRIPASEASREYFIAETVASALGGKVTNFTQEEYDGTEGVF